MEVDDIKKNKKIIEEIFSKRLGERIFRLFLLRNYSKYSQKLLKIEKIFKILLKKNPRPKL